MKLPINLSFLAQPLSKAVIFHIYIFTSTQEKIIRQGKGFSVRRSSNKEKTNGSSELFLILGITFQRNPQSNFFILLPLLLQHRKKDDDNDIFDMDVHDFHSIKLPPKLETMIDFHIDISSNIFWKLVRTPIRLESSCHLDIYSKSGLCSIWQ